MKIPLNSMEGREKTEFKNLPFAKTGRVSS